MTNEQSAIFKEMGVAQSTTKVLKAQGEYWHAGHLAELLIEADHCLRTALERGLPDVGLSAAAIRKCKVPERAMRLVRAFT